MNTLEVAIPGHLGMTLLEDNIKKCHQVNQSYVEMSINRQDDDQFHYFPLYLICYLRSILIQSFITYSFSQ